jgi:hypothetical protein
MSDKTTAKTRAEDHPRGDEAPAHPLDAWLRRQLKAQYAECESEPLPEGMAQLAERLKLALTTCGRNKKSLGSN